MTTTENLFFVTINPFTKETEITIKDETFTFQFTELDEWDSFEYSKNIYDVHFHYDEKIWFSIYKNVVKQGYENNQQEVKLFIKLSDDGLKISESKFPNGFDDWQETHFEMVQRICQTEHFNGSKSYKVATEEGIGGLYLLAENLTDKFEQENKGKNWGENDETQYVDAIEKFTNKNL